MEPDIAALQYPYLAVRKANGRYALLHPIVGTVEKSDTTLHAELFDWLMAEHKGFDLHRFCTEIPQWQARAMAKRPLIDIEKSMAREDISPTERQYLEEALAYHKRAYADFKKEVLDPDAPARPRVYVSGPVSGHDLAERIETFQKAAKALMRNSDLRPSAVVNPVDLTRDWIEDGPDGQPMPTRSYADFMRKDILALLSCDAIAMLPGWEKSVGASAELAVALSLGMKAWQLDENFSSSELPLDNRWLVR